MVKLLNGLVVALRLTPPDAIHHHGGIGITGHHAEQASFVIHHPLLRDIPDERILGAQHRRLIIHPVPQRNRQITQLAVDIADVGHREALVLVTLFQFLPQKIQRIVVGPRLAAYIAAVRAACAAGGRSVTNIDGSHAGYLHLTPCQRQRHHKSQQHDHSQRGRSLPVLVHGVASFLRFGITYPCAGSNMKSS